MTKLKSLYHLLAGPSRGGDAQVHFHQGPQGAPAACHNPSCSAPHLSV